MYIHQDFIDYGAFELMENCLIDLANDIFLSKTMPMNFSRSIYAFRRWEALILLFDPILTSITRINDDKRCQHMIRLIGACSITILNHLLPKSIFKSFSTAPMSKFDRQQIHKVSQYLLNFKIILQHALIIADRLLSTTHAAILQVNIDKHFRNERDVSIACSECLSPLAMVDREYSSHVFRSTIVQHRSNTRENSNPRLYNGEHSFSPIV
jgi:hypothetical protein